MKTLLSSILAALISGLVCLTFSSSFGQGLSASGKISGIVVDSLSKKPQDFITVNLMLGGNAIKADFTKTDGSFAFQKLKPARYSIVIVGVGFKTKTLTADLSDSTQNQIDLGSIDISPSTVGLKEVTVTALKPIVKQEVDRTIYDMQADPESKVYSVLEMMRKVPFLSVDMI